MPFAISFDTGRLYAPGDDVRAAINIVGVVDVVSEVNSGDEKDLDATGLTDLSFGSLAGPGQYTVAVGNETDLSVFFLSFIPNDAATLTLDVTDLSGNAVPAASADAATAKSFLDSLTADRIGATAAKVFPKWAMDHSVDVGAILVMSLVPGEQIGAAAAIGVDIVSFGVALFQQIVQDSVDAGDITADQGELLKRLLGLANMVAVPLAADKIDQLLTFIGALDIPIPNDVLNLTAKFGIDGTLKYRFVFRVLQKND